MSSKKSYLQVIAQNRLGQSNCKNIFVHANSHEGDKLIVQF